MNLYQSINFSSTPSDKIAITEVTKLDKRDYSYQKLHESVIIIEEMLKELELQSGDRVALIGKNSMHLVAGFLAIAKAGLISVPVDKELPVEEIKRQLNHAQVQGMIGDIQHHDLIDSGFLIDITSLEIRRRAERNADVVDGDDDVATIIYSSGTTGRARGIMHTHDSLLNSTFMTIAEQELNSKDKYLGLLPACSHIYGVICTILGPLLTGSEVCYVQEMDGSLIQKTMQEYKPTVFPGVPRMFELFYNQIKKKTQKNGAAAKIFNALRKISKATRTGKLILSPIHKAFGGNLRRICCAGSAISKEISSFFLDAGFNFIITYGATETGIPTIGNRIKNLTADTCGRPYPTIETRVEEEQLYIRSPYSMKGYWRDPERTAQVKRDGWIATGDLVQIDTEGNYRITGRCKDTIQLSTGKKVDPSLIEQQLTNIAAGTEIIACGVPDEHGNDEIHVFIVSDSADKVIAEKIKQFPLDHGMYISEVHFVQEIPKTSLQKPKRFLLKENRNNGSKQVLTDRVKAVISRVSGIPSEEIKEDSKIFKELRLDSIGSCELYVELEEEFGMELPNNLDPELTVAQLRQILKVPQKEVESKYPMARNRADLVVISVVRTIFKGLYAAKIMGQEYLPDKGGYIICSNHVSNFDYLWLTRNMKKDRLSKLYCVAKAELLKLKVIGKVLFRAGGLIPVNRNGIAGETMRSCAKELKEGCGLIVLPEGTRSANGKIGEFKAGSAMLALEAKVPVIPAYIEGAYEIYPKWRKLPRLLTQRLHRFKVTVCYGKPIIPDGYNIETLTRTIEEAVKELRSKITEE